MDNERLERLLQKLVAGDAAVEEVLAEVSGDGGEDLGFARIDGLRESRCGFPEVIYGAGKTPAQLLDIARHFVAEKRNLLVTRLTPDAAAGITTAVDGADYDPSGRTLLWYAKPPARLPGDVAVVCAGTSDLPVADECCTSLSYFGLEPRRVVDVGVAGLHRLLARGEDLVKADVVIVIAGMEGALPSVVGGLVAVPVIAVPTSAGYGTSFGGVTALLGMLNSCASGVTVVNVDNGFGAACAAKRILRQRPRRG